MTNSQIFTFESSNIRTAIVDGDIVFCLSDCLKSINSNTIVSNAEKAIIEGIGKEFLIKKPLATNGGMQKATFVFEAGLTFLVARSRTELGKKFNRWLHTEVLPSIRKTGSYSVKKRLPDTHIEAVKQLLESLEEQKRLAEANEKMAIVILENQPKVNYANAVMYSDTSLDFNEYAKLIGWGRNKLMAKLRELNILMKNSTLPYQRLIDAGHFEVSQEIIESGKLIPFAMITGKGQIWLKQKIDKSIENENKIAHSLFNSIMN